MEPVHILEWELILQLWRKNASFQGQTKLDPWQLRMLTTHTIHCLSFLSLGKYLKFKDNPNLHWAWQYGSVDKALMIQVWGLAFRSPDKCWADVPGAGKLSSWDTDWGSPRAGCLASLTCMLWVLLKTLP